MPETINWTVSLQVPMGPRVAQSGALTVEAYDKVSVALDPAATDVDVDVQPTSTAGQVALLAITASAYDPLVTYSPDAGATTFALEAPVALIGAGAVGLLRTAPEQLRFANGTAEAVTVEVLVGRDATP